ncbi:MAG: tRNA (guanosine(37)-N1)-methyltransferase TrmD, partial [Candidatus Berkelbacteria bacterium]
MMRFDIITLFPEMFVGPFSESILKKAQLKDLISINFHALR